MIASQDRTGWFGASDTDKIIGKWGSNSWNAWYLEKLGIPQKRFETKQMNAGTHWEHKILESISPFIQKDKQVLLPDLCLRVNLDGNTDDCIFEVKTTSNDKVFKMPQKYINQVQVQMFATGIKKAEIIVYKLTEEEYKNYFLTVDKSRLIEKKVEYNPQFINEIYLPKLNILSDCIKQGIFPKGAIR